MSRYIERPTLVDEYFNRAVTLPFGLSVTEVKAAINSTYDFLHDVNTFLIGKGYERLEDLLLGNSFAGILSEVMVKNLANHSATLVRNHYIGGYPDLILRGGYENDSILRGREGIEVKASKQAGVGRVIMPKRGG